MKYYHKIVERFEESEKFKTLGIEKTFLEKVLIGEQDSHGGGDRIIAKSILDAMFEGKDPQCGIEEGLVSAITCLKIDEARE